MSNNKITNVAPTTARTEMEDAARQSKIAAALESTVSKAVTRIRRARLAVNKPAVDYNFGESGADGTIYQCTSFDSDKEALAAGKRIRGEKAVLNDHATTMDGKAFGSVHLSRFHSGDPMALIVSAIRGLVMINVAANRGRKGHIKNASAGIKTKALPGCEDYYAAVGGLAVEDKWKGPALVGLSIVPGSWLDAEVEKLGALIQEIGIVAPVDKVLAAGSKRGGDQTGKGKGKGKDGASSSVSLDFGTPEALAGVRAYFGASTNSALSVILADLVKAKMATGKVPLSVAS